ncbi:MAG TPA: MOSC domain-containing protein [Opitutaceae bacterium]|nr:MOSC domain-containing protein [Opitutaceae bacterium]
MTTPPSPTGTTAPVHLSRAELENNFGSLPPAPKNTGRVALIVRRPATDLRELPDRVELSPEHGVPGDGWGRNTHRITDNQVTVMRHDVASLLANGQPPEIAGDNLFVDLDLSDANLPAGTRLRVGAALVEVTPEPHNGCSKFRARFGADGLAFVQAKETRHLNLRGIHFRVIEAGEVAVGSEITVLSRP